jgi:hypothetical protein
MFGRNTRTLPLNYNNKNVIMQISFKVPVLKQQPVVEIVKEIPAKKSMIWGEPTWLFLHTTAEKVKNESFGIIRFELLKHIYNICTNLPCPYCSAHAKTYLNSINFNSISTKEDLKRMLFTFHNVVNARKHNPIFPIEELDSKYSKANTRNIFKHFIVHFNDTYRSPGMIADDLFRKQMSKSIVEWFNINNIHFD